jgi:hypothetical protein
LSKIAIKIPSQAKLVSQTRQLSKFLDNSAIHVREWYESTAREWLGAWLKCLGEIHLILDCTKIGFKHQMLVLYLAYRNELTFQETGSAIPTLLGLSGGFFSLLKSGGGPFPVSLPDLVFVYSPWFLIQLFAENMVQKCQTFSVRSFYV